MFIAIIKSCVFQQRSGVYDQEGAMVKLIIKTDSNGNIFRVKGGFDRFWPDPVAAAIRLACILYRDDYCLTNRVLVKNPLSNVNCHPKSKHRSCR